MKKIDLIRDNFFAPAEKAEKMCDVLFFLGYLTSVLVLMIDKNKSECLYQTIYYAFPIIILATFTLSLINRFYLLPRATDKRAGDFFSHAFGVELSSDKTQGYYNNDFTKPKDKIIAGLLENSFHTKFICKKMAEKERVLAAIAFITWGFCLIYRRTDLEMIAAITQVIFSEQVVSKFIRVEWLRCRSERVFDDVFKLFQGKSNSKAFEAMMLESLVIYETTKAYSGLLLSSTIFEENRVELAKEWESIQKKLSRKNN